MEELLRPKDIRQLFGLSHVTLWQWEKEGKIKPVKTPGGHRRYRLSDVEALFQPKEHSKVLTFPLRVTRELMESPTFSRILGKELEIRCDIHKGDVILADKIRFEIEVENR